MIKLIHLNAAEYEQAVLDAGLALPVEQTAAWASYENTVPDRHFWGGFAIQRDDELGVVLCLIDSHSILLLKIRIYRFFFMVRMFFPSRCS